MKCKCKRSISYTQSLIILPELCDTHRLKIRAGMFADDKRKLDL